MEAEREQEGLMAATQDAIDATSTAYAEDAHLDVEEHFRKEMQRHGLAVTDDEWVRELAHNIRSGHPVIVGP
jgi:hypothetical protein